MSRGQFCALLAVVCLCGHGCGAPDAPLLSGSEAKTALTTALDSWKAGKPASELSSLKPPIQAVDSDWAGGKALESYTIGEESPGEGNKTFSVAITTKGSSGPSNVKYMVFGTDLVRIYRDIDFERMANMDNNPAPAKGKR